ncbi:hypothetical protein SS1G_13147 [Sclerotinia sclerotiorum 1980 UF-70]|uniref:Uncharacterized protein n=2 Tax=Sclerotinia sclerotiorum (strain ATCC 18683 / 1980 / Ss-1) TaxID=665079 RepID=A7F6B8_SCLS1|nr:hypothetical protein SS1G_13147 [Sclerotinia sclerotiorum 1980 UF-70]APA07304.1 hypothetical protein sscle_02g020740 [Sclerotinia sclerotiorum 1980 UF-70]EDN98289.1 hypothetical protein SS1G_13147 [Sclerotinia sclerotiorum 1980 UF-70]
MSFRSRGRYSNDKSGYYQHIQNSSDHGRAESSKDEYSSSDEEPKFECEGCDTWFLSIELRENH